MKLNKKELLEINKKFYEDFGGSFSSKRFFPWESFYKLKEYIKECDSVLDIGAGNGRFAEFIASSQYTGIDFSSTLTALAKEKYPEHTFLNLDITEVDWNLNLGKFNKIFLIAVLHHIPDYKIRLKLFKDIKKILDKNGLFIFSIWDFNIKSISTRISPSDYLLSWDKNIDLRYVHRFEEQEISQLIHDSKFKLKDSFILEKNTYFILS